MILVYMCSLCNYIQQKNILNVTFSTEKHFKTKSTVEFDQTVINDQPEMKDYNQSIIFCLKKWLIIFKDRTLFVLITPAHQKGLNSLTPDEEKEVNTISGETGKYQNTLELFLCRLYIHYHYQIRILHSQNNCKILHIWKVYKQFYFIIIWQ